MKYHTELISHSTAEAILHTRLTHCHQFFTRRYSILVTWHDCDVSLNIYVAVGWPLRSKITSLSCRLRPAYYHLLPRELAAEARAREGNRVSVAVGASRGTLPSKCDCRRGASDAVTESKLSKAKHDAKRATSSSRNVAVHNIDDNLLRTVDQCSCQETHRCFVLFYLHYVTLSVLRTK